MDIGQRTDAISNHNNVESAHGVYHALILRLYFYLRMFKPTSAAAHVRYMTHDAIYLSLIRTVFHLSNLCPRLLLYHFQLLVLFYSVNCANRKCKRNHHYHSRYPCAIITTRFIKHDCCIYGRYSSTHVHSQHLYSATSRI